MKLKNKWGKIVIILVIAVLFLTTVSFAAVNNSNKDSSDKNINDTKIQTVDNTQQNVISQEKMIELYNKGYGVGDIEKAAELAPVYGISIDEILKLKGPVDYKYKDNKSSNKQEILEVEDTSKKWNDVVSDLEIDKAAKEGKFIKDNKATGLKEQLRDLRENGRILKGKELKKSRELMKKELLKKYNITDSEINKCKEAGLTEIEEISYAKKKALDNNVTLEKVLENKKDMIFWGDTSNSIGGGKK